MSNQPWDTPAAPTMSTGSGRGGARPGAGRKPKGDATIHCSMKLSLIGRIDLWRSKRGLLHSRPDAVRELVTAGLDAEAPREALVALLSEARDWQEALCGERPSLDAAIAAAEAALGIEPKKEN